MLTIRDAAPESYQVRPESLENKVKNENDAIAAKSDFRLWQATHLSTKNPINKLAMNNSRLLITAVFHFVYSVEKDS